MGKFEAALLLTAIVCTAQTLKPRSYPSHDKALTAIVTPVSKGEESVIEIRSAKGEAVWKLSLQSPDGEHGEVVNKAAWTPDSRFFVISSSYSGGHSPLMHPTRFWDRKQSKAYDFGKLGAAITEPQFHVYYPDVVSTEVRNCKDPDSDVGMALVVNLKEVAETGKLPESFLCRQTQ